MSLKWSAITRINRSYRKCLWIVLLVNGIIPGAYALYTHEHGNFHPVIEHRVYRSRQLDQQELVQYISQHGIKTVLNLRGTNLGSAWYQDERRVTQDLGVAHVDYAISANHEVADEDIDKILAIMRDAPKPILIHCKSGADRTSLIAALYLYGVEARRADEAAAQLSLIYGHVPFLWNSTAAMDHTYWRYVGTHPSRPVNHSDSPVEAHIT